MIFNANKKIKTSDWPQCDNKIVWIFCRELLYVELFNTEQVVLLHNNESIYSNEIPLSTWPFKTKFRMNKIIAQHKKSVWTFKDKPNIWYPTENNYIKTKLL